MQRRQFLCGSLAATLVPGIAGPDPVGWTVFPERPKGVAVLVHGGAWVVGWSAMPAMRRLGSRLAEEGFAVVSVRYTRLWQGGHFEQTVEETLVAAGWAQAQAASMGADPRKTVVLGASAGAATGAVAATRLAAPWVGFYGPYDFTRLPGSQVTRLPASVLLGSADPILPGEVSPLMRAVGEEPCLLIHGTRDSLVPVQHSEALAARRTRLGLPTETRWIRGAPHGFLRWPVGSTRVAVEAAVGFAVDRL